MPKVNGLTQKEIKLIRGILEGKTKQQAAFEAYQPKNIETASVMAAETLARPRVQEVLQAELAKQGITMDKVIAPVAKALKATVKVRLEGEVIDTGIDDLEMQLKGHDRAMKILVDRTDPGAGNTFIQINQHINEQREKYKL